MSDLREHLQSTLGNAYVLDRELGGGGMSRVFVADDVGLHRRLVVKVLPAELAADVSLARFEREIALAARLQHPHIVPLLSAGETNGLPYYTMPFIEGESLRQRLSRGELPVAEAVRLTREIASALAYAHDHGVVHRDVKPENVLLSGGIALVADFGVAKAVSDAAAARGITGTGIAVGTPAYMSPEQVSADPNVDHRSDIYALGLIAYEMLAGQSPFAGRTAQALLAAHVVSTPEPVQQRRASVPDGVAELVMRCLEKNPADRPQTALEIIQTLDTLTTPTPTGTRARRTSVVRRSRMTAIVAAIALVIVASALWMARAYWGTAPVAPVATRLLIAPFENLTGDPRFDHIGLIAADRLALRVTQRGSIDVVPSTTVLMTLRDTTGGTNDRITRLSEASHASLIVTGTVLLRGDSLTLQAQIRDVRAGKASATLDPATGPAADPTSAMDVLSDRLLGALGAQELTKFMARGFRAPTFAAYQEFAGGWELFVLKGDNVGSRPYFERAIAIDSTYVLAYQLLARQYLNTGEYARADSIERIIEHLPLGLNAVERLNLEYAKAELRGDIAGLFRAQQELVARDSSALSLNLSGEAGVWMLRPSVAIPALEHAHSTLRVMGGWAQAHNEGLLAQANHQAGRHQLERRVLTDDRKNIPDRSYYRGRLLQAYAGLRMPAEGLAVADTLLRLDDPSGPTALVYVLTGADEFRVHGDSITAAQLLARARAWITIHQQTTPSSNRQLVEGMVFWESGVPDSAIARFTLAARDTSRIEAAGYLALARLARGDRVSAQSVADSLGALKRPWMFGVNTFWRAAILGALGDRERAVQLLRQAHTEGQPMDTWHSLAALQPLHGYPAFEALMRPDI